MGLQRMMGDRGVDVEEEPQTALSGLEVAAAGSSFPPVGTGYQSWFIVDRLAVVMPQQSQISPYTHHR